MEQHILVTKRLVNIGAFWRGNVQDQYILGMCSQLAKNFLKDPSSERLGIGHDANFLGRKLFPNQEIVQTTDHFKQSKTRG